MALVERLLSDFIRSLTSERRGQLPRWERGIRALRVYFDGQPQPARHETALRDLVRDTDVRHRSKEDVSGFEELDLKDPLQRRLWELTESLRPRGF